MATERFNPLNDFLFLKVMGEKGSEEQLLAFINAVLRRAGDKRLESVEILEDRAIAPDILGIDDPLHRWATFFDKNSPNELIEEVVKMDAAIQKAQERITRVTQDESALRAYEMREKAIMDWNSGVNHAIREDRKDIARKMKTRNMPTDEIIDYTGLTEKQVNEL